MDCYSINNPYKGQICMQDGLGRMIYDGVDWMLSPDNDSAVFDDAGNWIYSKKPQSGVSVDSAKSFIQKYWITIFIIGLVILLAWMFFKKRK